MKEELKGWISAYGTQMVTVSAVVGAKRLKPVIVLAVTNSAVDHNATYAMAEKSAKYLMDKFIHMGTKSGG